MEILPLLIGILIGLSTASLLWIKMIRRHYQNLTTIKKAQKNLESLISQIYHKDIYPELCRIEGLFVLSDLMMDNILKNCEMAEKPNHYRYIELVKKELIELRQQVLNKGTQESVKLKNRFQQILNRYA